MHPMFIAALYIVAKTQKQPKWPSVEYIKKLFYIHTMEYYIAEKGIPAFCDSMDGPG